MQEKIKELKWSSCFFFFFLLFSYFVRKKKGWGDSQIVEEIKKKIPKSMKVTIKNPVTQRSESDMYWYE
jgi:hypothetical protein